MHLAFTSLLWARVYSHPCLVPLTVGWWFHPGSSEGCCSNLPVPESFAKDMMFSVVILIFLLQVSSLFADTPLHLCSLLTEEAFRVLLLPSWSAAELCLDLSHALFMY